MSEMYEGIVFRSDERTARRTFKAITSPLRLRLVKFARGTFGIYRIAGRSDTFETLEMERIAQRISTDAGRAVALFYDNSCGIRVGVLFTLGSRTREFGDGDAWWMPLDGKGKFKADGPRFRVTELKRGQEYECVLSAIDAALEAVGATKTVSAELVVQAYCYDELQPLSDSGAEG